jgi:hypothetical protein
MPNTVFAWRNWCVEHGSLTATIGSFESQAPLNNLLSPQLGQKAISTSYATQVQIRCDWGGSSSPPLGLPLGMIAILAHNMAAIPISSVPPNVFYQIGIQLTDSSGATYSINAVNRKDVVVRVAGDFQSHFIWFPPAAAGQVVDLSKISAIRITLPAGAYYGKLDPYTGDLEVETFSAGGIWAGPVWRPDRGIRFGSFTSGITEARRGATSLGGQYYPLPQARRRRLSGDFTLTAESETFRLPESGFGLQQMAAWCATSRPVICIPDISDPDLIYTQGIYGYFDNDTSWSHFDTSSKERQYRGSFSITEAL